MSATLRMTREGIGIELRRGRFEVVVDGKSVGSIERHETIETLLEPGHHTLRARPVDIRAAIIISTLQMAKS